MRKYLHITSNYAPILFALLLPFGLNLSILIILWFGAEFLLNVKAIKSLVNNSKWLLICLSFFVIYVISALVSDNVNGSSRAIELKLGFLSFPLLFLFFKVGHEKIKKILIAFVSGNCFAALICILRAFFLYFAYDDNSFYYNKFSYFIHAGYFSMYLLFSLVLVLMVYPVIFKDERWLTFIRFILACFFVITIILCASKIGVIALLIVGILMPLIRLKDSLTLKKVGIGLITLISISFVLYQIAPLPFERIGKAIETTTSSNIDKNSTESTAVRILIWTESLEIVKSNFLFGVGAADANSALIKSYETKGLTGALKHNLNAHNQFLQTAIETGVIGLFVLLIMTIGAVFYALFKKNYILVLFSIIITLNFLVESMLQTQAGNLFYCFFLCLLLSTNVIKLRSSHC